MSSFNEIFSHIRVAFAVQEDIDQVTRQWALGRPTEEVAFLNRITERLSRPRICSDTQSSALPSIVPFVEVFNLHRKGAKQKDLFGSDFAVTVSIPERNFLKTALFQLKVSKLNKVHIRNEQLKQAFLSPLVRERAFVFVVDNKTNEVRICHINGLLPIFSGLGKSTLTLNIEDDLWQPPFNWTLNWLECKTGALSEPNRPYSIESWLSMFCAERVPKYDWLQTDIQNISEEFYNNLPRNYVVSKLWLVATLRIAS